MAGAVAEQARPVDAAGFLDLAQQDASLVSQANPLSEDAPGRSSLGAVIESGARNPAVRRRVAAEATGYGGSLPTREWLWRWMLHRGAKGLRQLPVERQEQYVRAMLDLSSQLDDDRCGRVFRSGPHEAGVTALSRLGRHGWDRLSALLSEGLAAYAEDPSGGPGANPMAVLGGLAALRKLRDMDVREAFQNISNPAMATDGELCRSARAFLPPVLDLDLPSRTALLQVYVGKL